MNTPTLIRSLAITAFFFTQVAAAAGVQITSTVLHEVEHKTLDGRTVVDLVDTRSAAPGEKLRFQLAIKNETAKPADNLLVTNPIPHDVEFMSASNGAEVSVDGGKSFGALAALTVKPLAGTPRAAQAADVTHVRWRITNSIAPGAGSEVFFAARIK